MSKRAGSLVLVLGLCLVAYAVHEPIARWFQLPSGAANARTAQAEPVRAVQPNDVIDHYTCSMHPSVRQRSLGKCPLCGMDLIAVTQQQQQDGVVLIDEAHRQLVGVRTEPVKRGVVVHSVRAVGHVTYDETTLTDVSLKVNGWVTKLFVNATGQHVARGQTLFTFYSPELYSAQQDFLSARGSARALTLSDRGAGAKSREPWTKAGVQRLHLLGMDDAQIAKLSRREEPLESTAISAPASGYVIEKQLVEGGTIMAGARLFRIAKLDKVWVEAELYEADFVLARVGQQVKVTLDYVPGRSYAAKIAYVYPTLDAASRTGRVRVELVNTELELRPGMYATVELSSRLDDRVLVPESAVVYTGPRRLVFVDLGHGQLKPREVRLGAQSDGAYEVLEGVEPGDVVATSGTFLIAAEARIGGATTYWDEAAALAADVPPLHEPEPGPGPPRSESKGPDVVKLPMVQPVAPAGAAYVCPMHPAVRSDVPADCPKCGMKLVPTPAGSAR